MFDRGQIEWPLEVELRLQTDVDLTALDALIVEISNNFAEFAAIVDESSTCVLIGGADECQLEKNQSLFQSRFECEIDVGPPQVGYRETIRKAAEVDVTPAAHGRDDEQLHRVRLRVEPRQPGAGNEFRNEICDLGDVDERVAGVEVEVRRMLNEGALKGYALIDLSVILVGDAATPADVKYDGVMEAVRQAFREAVLNAGVVVMEPLVFVEVKSPEEFLGGVIGDLNSRRGHILETAGRDDLQVLTGRVPVTNMLGYADTLAGMTQNRGSFSVRSDRYQEVTADDWIPPHAGAVALST